MGIKRVPTYFNEFACIGGACEDNCCIGWDVVIDVKVLKFTNRSAVSLATGYAVI